jgi:hypothetical protein
MRPVLKPENVYAHPHQEQDVILWYNRALWHSIVSLAHTALVRLALIACVDRVSKVVRTKGHAPVQCGG